MNQSQSGLHDLPEYDELGLPAVRLLQGAVYSDDLEAWDTLLARESDLVTWLAKIGLVLVIDRAEGMAYVTQLDDDHRTGGYEHLPRLFRRTPLGYAPTLLCVLLREEYRRFEDEDLENERCVVEVPSLLEEWKQYFPADSDEVRLRRQLLAALASLEKLKFVRKFGNHTNAWEVCRLLKARLPIEELEALRDRMQLASAAGGDSRPA